MDRRPHKLMCLWFCDVLLFNEDKVDISLGFHLWPFVITLYFLSCVDRLEVGGIGVDCSGLHILCLVIVLKVTCLYGMVFGLQDVWLSLFSW